MVLAVGLILASCKQENKTSYVVNGNAEGVHNGIRVRLAQIDKTGNQVMKDSAIVMDGKFTIKGSVDEPGVYFLSADGSPGNAIFMLENSDITIDFNSFVCCFSFVSYSIISNSKSNIIRKDNHDNNSSLL